MVGIYDLTVENAFLFYFESEEEKACSQTGFEGEYHIMMYVVLTSMSFEPLVYRRSHGGPSLYPWILWAR